MRWYKCDFCGCYLDPGEGRTCEECRKYAEQRANKRKKMGEAISLSQDNQYEMILEVGR